MGCRSVKIAVVTGGSAGVGRAVVRAFAARGVDVAVLARGEARVEEACAEAREAGVRALGVAVDVGEAAAVNAAAASIERELGPIDCWVNNAMTSVFAPVSEIDADEFARVTQVTYLGVVHGTLAVLPHMRERGRGVIVQVGSALAYRGIPLQAPYCASKHAIVGFTESLRSELLHDGSGVWVTMVHLPAMNTPQFEWVLSRLDRRAQPVPPIYAPEVAARAIVWASEHRRREVLVGFPTIKTIWGNRLAPWYVDRVLARRGYESQQTGEPERPDRPANLWESVPGEYAAQGRFGSRARARAPWTTLSMHPWMGVVVVLGVLALLAAASLIIVLVLMEAW